MKKLTTVRYLAGALLLACSAGLSSAADYPTTVLSYNPVGYWRLGQSVSPPAADTVANSGSLGAVANGFPYPGTSIGRSFPGIVGTSFNFTNVAGGNNYDGNDTIDVPYNAALNPTGPFTLEVWANPSPDTGAAALVSPIASLDVNANRSGFLLYFDNNSVGSGVRWEFRTGGLAGYATTIDSGAIVAGNWYHVVCVWDGTLVTMYVNGVQAAQGGIIAGRTWNPNTAQPFRIGGTTFPNRSYSGGLDEVAFYGSALSASAISNHYYLGINSPGTYAASVASSSPLGYWHLNEGIYTPPNPTTLPIATNSGTLGALANGTNYPGVTTGVAGPPFAGFPASNLGVQTLWGGGAVAVGNPDGLNFAGPITMMAWVKPQFTDGLRNILAHGFRNSPDQEVQLRINAGDYEVGSWSPGEGTNSTGGRAAADVGNWVFVTATYDGANWSLYRYDQLIAGPTPGVNGALVMDAPWALGARGDFTSDGRFLGGGLDEVAIFTNALSLAQIQSIYYSAKMSPIILKAPQAPTDTVYEGGNLTFTVEAAGNPTLLYQWTKNSAPLGGQTGTSLTLNNVTTGSSGTYAIVVTNNYGSITSSFALTVLAGPPLLTQQTTPVAETRFVGATAAFSVAAVGSPTLTYQWYQNTNTTVGSSTATYSKPNVQLADAGKYDCKVTNPYGNTNSSYSTLTVLAAPTTPYPGVALSDNPVGYWRLGESSGTVAHDYWGGHDGVYNNVTLGQPGYSPLDADTSAKFTASGTYVGSINGIDFAGTSSPFSLEAWVNGSTSQPATDTDTGSTIISKGRGGNGAGGTPGWQFILDVTGGKYHFLVQSATARADATAAVGPDGTWQHVVATYSQDLGMTIYVNGQVSGQAGAPAGGPLASLSPVSIGAGLGGVTPVYNAYFNGNIDEAAIYNYALSAAQVHAHVCGQYGAGHAPVIVSQPASVTTYEGWPVTLLASISGSCELTYQWKKGNTVLTDSSTITGSTSNRLDIYPVTAADSGNYTLVANNSVGNATSAVAVLSVLLTPTNSIPISGNLVLHLPFNTNLTDVTGHGNDGTGKHTTPAGTTTLAPSAAIGGAFEYTDGKLGQGLHYSSDAGPPGSGSAAGTNDYYVSLGVKPELKFGSNVNFSVAYWIRMPVNFDLGDLPFLCDATNSTGGHGITFAPSYGSNAVFTGGTSSGSWAWSLNATRIEGPDYLLNDGAWHHLVHTYNRQSVGITYLDGVQVDSRSITTVGDLNNAAPLSIGQDPTGAYAETGSMDIDDLGIWRRVLSPVEAKGLYVAGTNGFSFVDLNPTVRSGPGAAQVTITWQSGILQQADVVGGPYTDVPGLPTSPLTINATLAKKFYRVRQ